MFFLLSKILALFFQPLFWIIVLMITSFLVKKIGLRNLLRITAVVFLLTFTNSWITSLVLERQENKITTQLKQSHTYDVAIVLGGGMVKVDHYSGSPVFNRHTDRIWQAVALYKQKVVRKILISGGSARVIGYAPPESLLLKNYLVENAIVPARDILIDTLSRNTRENAVEVKKLLGTYKGSDRFLLLTSALHMKRSLDCFRKVDMDVTPVTTDRQVNEKRTDFGFYVLPKAGNLLKWNDMIHEWVGRFVYRVMGYI